MSTFDSAFQIVSNLVKDFKENEKYYLSQNYQEADVRNDFINKFFIALGWDVRHETQKNPYEQEVRVEKPLFIAKAQKRADYSFALAPDYRTVKFFVEAKKPSHDLTNKDYYFQTARYGWNATTPVAVLTDFEEFHIVDCRFRPSIDDALNYKLKKFHYSDYADKEKFSEIYWLFSHEAVANGSIEKYADALPKPRGKKAKAVKGITQSIDEAFLEELDEIRNELAKSFKKNNEYLTSEELTEATQRTIDRLVFIKFLEDKLIEPDHYVSNFGKRKSAWEDFLNDSRKLEAKYNGVVFKKTKIDERNIIEPDDKTFSAICDDLSHENTPYNFDAIPIHILGSIYERFLGKVVHATDKRVTIEEKPEVRKAGGVYYTPQYIVNYIVDNTIGKLVEGKTPKEISKLRFADIACGSGSFLITVYERILDYHKRWYLDNPEQAKKDGCILYEGAYRLSLKQKQVVLTNNIYGVDIDQQAVEVSQLSLYLKLLEDETTATANDTWVLFKEQLLPNLNKNIVCGNSLIGTDILESDLFDYEEEKRIKPMDFENVFPAVMHNGGFDAIVGNPPYSAKQSVDTKKFAPFYSTVEYKCDLFAFFVEKGYYLLNATGKLGFIIPVSWMTNIYYRKLRALLIESQSLEQINLIEGLVFNSANIDTNIIFLSKCKNKAKKLKWSVSKAGSLNSAIINRSYSQFSADEGYSISSEVGDKWYDIKRKVEKDSVQLKEISKISLGMKLRSNDEFIVFKKSKENPDAIVFGKDIGKYNPIQVSRYFNFKEAIIVGGTKNETIQRGCPKIFIQAIRNLSLEERIIATLDQDGYYFVGTVNAVTVLDDRFNYTYLLGLLNSKFFNTYFKKRFTTISLTASFLGVLPVKVIDFRALKEKAAHDKIVRLVNQMLAAKRQLQQAKTEGDKNYLERKCERLDKEIDQLVYKLYNLTKEEIKIVEEN